MGYFSTCNAESAISTCDIYNWPDLKTKPIQIREFSHNELVAATNGFSIHCFLGKGSQGSVYKAVLDNGKLIAAVKKTAHSKNSNNTIPTPAENEIEILSRVQNPRLVNLIGFCNSESKLIVVEYMPNGSLYDLLHSNSNINIKPPGWTRRIRFALQIAKAVHSLHTANPPVIHRDIKSSNVLIDGHRKARLGDFGLSLRGHVEDVRIKCTPPAGTLGYLDPGYIAPCDVSTKSDVFSFGILLLEIISGRHAIDLNYSPPSIVDWAVPMIKRSEFAGVCDRRLGSPDDFSINVCKLGLLAARCVRTRAEKRPEMGEVVECLSRVSKKMQSSAPLIWNSCKQHVTCVEQSQPSVAYTSLDGSDDGVKVSNSGYKRIGSRRNRKVSNVRSDSDQAVDYSLMGDNRVVRSRSVGSCNEMVYYKRKVKNKITAVNVRLSKSRSMSVLQCPKRDTNLSECMLLEKKSDISLQLRNILNFFFFWLQGSFIKETKN